MSKHTTFVTSAVQVAPVASKQKGWGANPASLLGRKNLNVGSLWEARTPIQSVHIELRPSDRLV